MYSISDIRRFSHSGAHSGLVDTVIPGVRLFWSFESTRWQPAAFDPGLIIVIQGQKKALQGARKLVCESKNALMVATELPLKCASTGSNEQPLLGLIIELDRSELSEMIDKMLLAGYSFPDIKPTSMFGMQHVDWDEGMQRRTRRLLELLNDPIESAVLAESYRRQIIFGVLQSESAPVLRELFYLDDKAQKIDQSIFNLNQHLGTPIKVEHLAAEVGMSVSSFHRAFKRRTGLPPLKYAKQIRLHVAKRLLAQKSLPISQVAHQLGYSSFPQFSREYKKLFGVCPRDGRAEAMVELSAPLSPLSLMP